MDPLNNITPFFLATAQERDLDKAAEALGLPPRLQLACKIPRMPKRTVAEVVEDLRAQDDPLAHQLADKMEAELPGDRTFRVESVQFGVSPGRTVIAESWQGTAQPLTPNPKETP